MGLAGLSRFFSAAAKTETIRNSDERIAGIAAMANQR